MLWLLAVVSLAPPAAAPGACTCLTFGVSVDGRCPTCGGWRPGHEPWAPSSTASAPGEELAAEPPEGEPK